MKASETNFQALIEGTKQYIVPMFQRPYSWQKKQWQELLDDLTDLYESEHSNSHFIGSIVTMPTLSKPENVTPYLLIDGQQRLTTIFILLALLRNIAKIEGKRLSDKIHNTLLTNQYIDGLEHYKLLPTQQDRADFLGLINDENESLNNSAIIECYKFFKHHIKNLDGEKLNQVIANRLSVVSIILESDDNPYVVFESLNAQGRALSQADLIRNYFFMRIPTDKQEKIYKTYWQPMQYALSDDLTEFMRHYLTSNGMLVKKSDVYLTLKQRVDKFDTVLNELDKIAQFSGYYEKFINPNTEENKNIRLQLKRIKDLEITVSYPFLLSCYHDYKTQALNSHQFIDILQVLENFVIRRFICNIPTHGLNKIFPVLYKNAKLNQPNNLINGIKLILQSQGYPKDNEFYQNLIDCKLYGNVDRRIKTRLILEALEKSFNHKEIEMINLDNLSIEHIMPQTLTKAWQKQLGDNWQEDYDLYVNSLGNLTLTAYNSELSNALFTEKKKHLKNSKLSLNSYFSEIINWNKKTIQERSLYLADIALKVWAYFGLTNEIENNSKSMTGKKPRTLILFDQDISVKAWTDLLINFLNTISDFEPELFKKLVEEYPHFINISPELLRRGKKINNSYYVETNLSADSIYRFCKQAAETIGLSNEDWHIEI
jgi:uncharacterized protein with ParB-like and HNH nuclease domain